MKLWELSLIGVVMLALAIAAWAGIIYGVVKLVKWAW
jgi:hypothetical protein